MFEYTYLVTHIPTRHVMDEFCKVDFPAKGETYTDPRAKAKAALKEKLNNIDAYELQLADINPK